MPANWTRPTHTWKEGEIIADKHTLTIHPDAPFGTWQIVAGMYQLIEDGQGQHFDRLRVIYPDGSQPLDYVQLSRVRIKAEPLVF